MTCSMYRLISNSGFFCIMYSDITAVSLRFMGFALLIDLAPKIRKKKSTLGAKSVVGNSIYNSINVNATYLEIASIPA